jgi:hypothetical protein
MRIFSMPAFAMSRGIFFGRDIVGTARTPCCFAVRNIQVRALCTSSESLYGFVNAAIDVCLAYEVDDAVAAQRLLRPNGFETRDRETSALLAASSHEIGHDMSGGKVDLRNASGLENDQSNGRPRVRHKTEKVPSENLCIEKR